MTPHAPAPVPPPVRATRADINVTPLIDIVLVLLIVFIVLVPGLSKALAVAVPRVVDGADTRGKDDIPLVVRLDPQGRLFLQQEEIALAQLAGRLAPVVQLQPMGYRKVYFKVDGEASHGAAVQVLDQIRLASEQATWETRARPGFGDTDGGGDIKVVVHLLKRG